MFVIVAPSRVYTCQGGSLFLNGPRSVGTDHLFDFSPFASQHGGKIVGDDGSAKKVVCLVCVPDDERQAPSARPDMKARQHF